MVFKNDEIQRIAIQQKANKRKTKFNENLKKYIKIHCQYKISQNPYNEMALSRLLKS